jgi:BON domain-containing protein
MIELPFGSVSSGWSGFPLTAWPPTASPLQSRPPSSVFPPQPMPTPPTPVGPVAFGMGFPLIPSPFVYAGGYPGLFPPPAPAPTISSLLMSVAIRRGQPAGPTNDQEIEDFIYDVLEMLPGTNEVEVRAEGGKLTLTGNVQHKRLKHDIGEIVWAIPNVTDVQNNIAITTKRRARPSPREEPQAAGQSRKQP